MIFSSLRFRNILILIFLALPLIGSGPGPKTRGHLAAV